MKFDSGHLLFGGILAFLFAAFVYAHVIKPLQLSIEICRLAQSINDECGTERACERDTVPSFKKMLDACAGIPVDLGGDDDDD
jgi:hypothetical protein